MQAQHSTSIRHISQNIKFNENKIKSYCTVFKYANDDDMLCYLTNDSNLKSFQIMRLSYIFHL